MFVREFKKSNCSSHAYPEQSFYMNLIFLDPLIFYVSRNRFVNLFSVFPNLFVRARIPLRASLAIIWFSTQSTTVFVQSLNLSVIPRRLKFAGHPEHGVASSSLIFSVISLERTRPMGGGVR